MKKHPCSFAGIAVFMAALVLIMTVARSEAGSRKPEILRGSGLELVDDGGKTRVRINVEADGEVVFRMIDQNGAIRVKLGGGKDGSGLVLLNEAAEVGIQMLAKSGRTSVRLSAPERKDIILSP
jgi:hypothetical protein